MRPEDYDFELPTEQIAQRPATERSAARMLVVGAPAQPGALDASRSQLRDAVAAQLLDFVGDALVVLNDSRVVPARAHLKREVDGRSFELLFCAPDPSAGPGQEVRAWVRGAKRLKANDQLELPGSELGLRYLGPDPIDPRARRFEIERGELVRALGAAGEVPLPPYIQREGGPDAADRLRYQSVFATHEGSVAAPTAGLHVDEAMLAQIDHARITLHVGPGTFLPMEAEDVREHRVGAERYAISGSAAAKIQAARDAGRPVLAVGTTVTRTLESVAARNGGAIVPGAGQTDLVIGPGHRFLAVDRLLTNFHLPKSSLLMLTATFGGRERVLAAYRHAVAEGYRFYSYGDCMLLWPAESEVSA